MLEIEKFYMILQVSDSATMCGSSSYTIFSLPRLHFRLSTQCSTFAISSCCLNLYILPIIEVLRHFYIPFYAVVFVCSDAVFASYTSACIISWVESSLVSDLFICPTKLFNSSTAYVITTTLYQRSAPSRL